MILIFCHRCITEYWLVFNADVMLGGMVRKFKKLQLKISVTLGQELE